MLLERLKEYSDQMDLPPRLYAERPVRYIIELDGEGRLLSSEPTDTADPGERRARRGAVRAAPLVQRSSGIRPLLLSDNAEYTLGLSREGSDQQRVARAHQAYLDLLSRCAQATHEPAVTAVLRFIRSQPLEKLKLPPDFDAGASITFRVAGAFPVDLRSVQKFWTLENEPGDDVMQCLICGRRRPVLKRLQQKVKGLRGGQTSGTSLISANAEAFESYGLKESLVAPVCADCSEAFIKGINDLLADPAKHTWIGDVTFVFWTREKVEFSFLEFLQQPQPEEVKGLLESVRTGRRQPEVDDTSFYAVALSGSGGRAVVRDWIDTTVGEAKANLAGWFSRQEIVDPWGESSAALALWRLAAATVRRGDEVPPTTARALLRSALSGGPLPMDLLCQAVRRARAEQDVDAARAALIKMVMQSRESELKEGAMVKLETDHPNPAYHCGRLLAVMERAQALAIPGLRAGVVKRFYGAASTAPASVFGNLLRGMQAHLAKLERDRPGAHAGLQRSLEEVMGAVDSFPRTLTLQEQGLFALGYYHQRAADRARAKAARQPQDDQKQGEASNELEQAE